MSHHPIDDQHKQYTLQEFVAAAKEELDIYQSTMSRTNDFHCEAHTWDEWMGSFKRYMSW